MELTVPKVKSIIKHYFPTAQSVLVSILAKDPAELTIAEQRVLGRITGGNVTGLTGAQIITLLGGTSRVFHVNAFQYPAPGTDWTPALTGAGLAQNLAAKKVWLPFNFLKVGDIITTYNLVGDVVEAAAATLDCKLVQINKADPITTTDITNGGMTQIVADGNFDSTVNCDDTTVATDKQYTLEILGTTGASDSIIVMGAEVTVTRLI